MDMGNIAVLYPNAEKSFPFSDGCNLFCFIKGHKSGTKNHACSEIPFGIFLHCFRRTTELKNKCIYLLIEESKARWEHFLVFIYQKYKIHMSFLTREWAINYDSTFEFALNGEVSHVTPQIQVHASTRGC